MVMIQHRFGYIDRDGQVVVPLRYEAGRNFRNGLAAVRDRSKRGFIDRMGREVIACQYHAAGSFSEGLAPVYPRAGDKAGYIDRSGRIVIEPQFDTAELFREGKAVVRNGNQVGVIDKRGKFISPMRPFGD